MAAATPPQDKVASINGSHGSHTTPPPPPPSSEQRTTAYVWAFSFFAAIGGFLFGYDTGCVICLLFENSTGFKVLII